MRIVYIVCRCVSSVYLLCVLCATVPTLCLCDCTYGVSMSIPVYRLPIVRLVCGSFVACIQGRVSSSCWLRPARGIHGSGMVLA